MKQVVDHAVHGKIEYEESFWTGKKKISINGTPLEKQAKGVFVTQSGDRVYMEGNYLTGSRINIGSERIQLTPPVKWYEIVLSVLPFLLIIIWSNSLPLVRIVPVIGGALGGAVSAVMSFLNLFIIKGIKPVWLKILISVCMLAATFCLCFLLGMISLSISN